MDTNDTDSRSGSTHRPPWLPAAAVALAVVVAGAVAVLLATERSETEYPAGSPQAVFQAYVRAWDAADVDAAWALLSAGAQEQLPHERFGAAVRRQPDAAFRIWIEEVSVDGDHAVLRVTVESLIADGLLGRERDRVERHVTLTHEAAGWKIENPTVAYNW